MTHEEFEGIDIKRELRAARSEPSEEFLSRLIARVRREHPRPRAVPRAVLAFAATAVALAVAAAFGGISQAAYTVSDAVTAIVHVGKAPAKEHVNSHKAAPAKAAAGTQTTVTSSSRSSDGLVTPPHPSGGSPGIGGSPSPSDSQYHGPCPPDLFRGPYIKCTAPNGSPP